MPALSSPCYGCDVLGLRWKTSDAWTEVVLGNFNAFLQDHANNERKVAQSALQLATHYPNHIALVDVALEIADEELQHYRQLWAILKSRGLGLGQDETDPYMKQLFALVRKRDMQEYLLDRLCLFGIVEARGCERFDLVAKALPVSDPLKEFYIELERSEARHHGAYHRLAKVYFPMEVIQARLDTLLDLEAEIASKLPLRAALH